MRDILADSYCWNSFGEKMFSFQCVRSLFTTLRLLLAASLAYMSFRRLLALALLASRIDISALISSYTIRRFSFSVENATAFSPFMHPNCCIVFIRPLCLLLNKTKASFKDSFTT